MHRKKSGLSSGINMSGSSSTETNPTFQTTESKPSQKPKLKELLLPYLEDPVLDYMSDENFESEKYSPASVGPTFFENRLPVITLLLHAVRGEYDKVDAMLKKNPLLLLEKDTVTDYSGRTHYKRTVYQLALGALDQDVIDEKGRKVVDGMKEMIENHFNQIYL